MATTSLASNERHKTTNIVVSEQSLRRLDTQAAEIEFKSAISKWTEWDVPWSTLYANNKFESFNL